MERNSFAAIEQKTHQHVNEYEFDFDFNQLDGVSAYQQVESAFESFKEILIDELDGTGEWEWLQKHKQYDFIKALFEKDIDTVAYHMTNMFKTQATYGYVSPSFSDVSANPKQVKSDILCNIDTCIEFFDLSDIQQLTISSGNPFGLKHSNGVIMPDTPRHYYYGYNISNLLGNPSDPVVLEIGGGYGGFCLEIWKRFNGNCTIVDVDIVPGLFVTHHFLESNNVPVNVISKTNQVVKENMVNLISAEYQANLLELLPKADVIFNSHSLCEMGLQTIEEYFKFINLCEVKLFYHDNSNFLLFPESERHVEVIGDRFPIDYEKFQLVTKYLTPFSGGNGRHREYIYFAK